MARNILKNVEFLVVFKNVTHCRRNSRKQTTSTGYTFIGIFTLTYPYKNVCFQRTNSPLFLSSLYYNVWLPTLLPCLHGSLLLMQKVICSFRSTEDFSTMLQMKFFVNCIIKSKCSSNARNIRTLIDMAFLLNSLTLPRPHAVSYAELLFVFVLFIII